MNTHCRKAWMLALGLVVTVAAPWSARGADPDTIAPTVVTINPTPSLTVVNLRQIEVFFSEEVSGVDDGDLLINNNAATNVNHGDAPGQYVFQFPQPATGTVSVAWAANTGIRDISANSNAFVGTSGWTYHLDPNAGAHDVRINEFMAQNTIGIRDVDGTYGDWIELYNASPVTVNLGGWHLSDDIVNRSKWRFPNGSSIEPNSYMIVWATEKNLTNISAPLHTNFRLDPDTPEYLGLSDPNTNVISEFAPTYPVQRGDVSYGRDRVQPTITGFYSVPTPGAPNSTAGAGFAPDVVPSRPDGTFFDPFQLTLSMSPASPGAVIRYILITNVTFASGNAVLTNVPTAASPAYSGPINVPHTMQVRARTFEPGKLPGNPVTLSFVQLAGNMRGFSSDLPMCVVHTMGSGAVSTGGDSSGLFLIFDNDFDRSSLTNQPRLVTRMGVNTRGSSTGGQAKSNFAVEFWDEFNQDTDKPFLDMPADSDWVLYGINGFDPGLMHNAIFHWFGNNTDKYASRTKYVEVFYKTGLGAVTTNDYFGLYLVEEKVKRGKDRVDIPPLQLENTNPPSITGGYLLKIDRNDADERTYSPPVINGLRTTPSLIEFIHPNVTPSTVDPRRVAQINYIQGYIQTFITNLTVASYTNDVTGYQAYIDRDQWIENLIGNIICFNVDGYRLSGYFFKDRNGKLQQGPYWDCDRCLGTGGTATPQGDNRCFSPRFWRLPANDVGTDNGTDFFGVSNVGVSWFSRLFRDPDFWQKFIDRYQEFRTNKFHTNAITEMVEGFHTEIKEAQVREQNRWAPSGFTYPRAGVQTVNGYTFDFGPNANLGRGYFSNEVNFQKKWLIDRLNFMDTNFLSMPVLSRGSALVTNGTTVSVNAAPKSGTVLLYTLDGTDPRLPGGAVSPAARTNIGTLTLTISNSVRLIARSFNTTHANQTNSGTAVGMPIINSFWSGPVAGSYYLGIPPLRITELMYHPLPPAPPSTNDQDLYEYVEVQNIGGTPLNVNRFRLRGGVDFAFPNILLPANGRAVIVRDVAAFQSRYGGSATILGSYTNNLGNDGDHLVLEGGVREPILDFNYQDGWYPITDGQGFALQIVNALAATDTWGLKASWRPSGTLNGTPGGTDSGPLMVAKVFITEALPNSDINPDAIEIWNSENTNVNVGGWFLTDDFITPNKYRIPDNTILGPGLFRVFYEDVSFGLGPNAFSLRAKGDSVYLFSADAAGNLTGWEHGYAFGAQVAGVTFGRQVTSVGDDDFVAQSAPTLGAASSGPKIGPVIISEINYHPPDLGTPVGVKNNTPDEYVELQNITGADVKLFDMNFLTNTWRLRGGIDYQFPMGTILGGGSYLLVVNFDPANASQVALFRSRMGVPANVPLYGPFSGELDNEGDNVELARPDVPTPPPALDAGTVAYVLVEKVNYTDMAPWPEGADGFGPSLQRISTSSYANDPASWASAGRTPGGSYISGASPSITQHPQSSTVVATFTAMFSVTATGPGPLSYQWRFNGNPISVDLIPTATSSTLILQNVHPSQAGIYSAIVLNSSGVAISGNATLTVLIPAQILMQPQSVNLRGSSNLVDYGNTTNNATFTVQATGSGPVSYQWRFNGTPILGANSTALTVMNVQLTNDGNYDVLITDDVATIASAPARLSVWITPVITQAPIAQTVPAGSRLMLSVAVRGNPPPFGYGWRSNSLVLPLIVSDLQTNYFSIITATNAVTATYRVVVTNAASQGNAVVATFSITTVADTDFDGLPDTVETSLGLNPNNPADGTGDLDHDGMSNRDEYFVGTDPNDTNSVLRIEQTTIPGMAKIQVSAVSNRTYSVQYSDVLPAAMWQKLASILARTTNHVELIPDPTWTSNRFYRLVVPAQP